MKRLIQPKKSKETHQTLRDRVVYLPAYFSPWFSTIAVPGDTFVTMRDSKSWNVSSSNYAKNTFNPIRNIIENLHIVPHPEKHMIALSVGKSSLSICACRHAHANCFVFV